MNDITIGPRGRFALACHRGGGKDIGVANVGRTGHYHRRYGGREANGRSTVYAKGVLALSMAVGVNDTGGLIRDNRRDGREAGLVRSLPDTAAVRAPDTGARSEIGTIRPASATRLAEVLRAPLIRTGAHNRVAAAAVGIMWSREGCRRARTWRTCRGCQGRARARKWQA